MKKLKIINIVVLLLLIFIGFSSCDEDVNDKKWGYSKIYMPQAVMLNGGISNIYPDRKSVV